MDAMFERGDESKSHIVCWDDNETVAKGWLVIDKLINDVSGGGLFMHESATLEETVDLSQSMSFKNSLQEPQFGGAKAGIRYDPRDPQAQSVLKRFLLYIRPYLEKCWCTGGDINTSTDAIDSIVKNDLGLPSAFYSLGQMISSNYEVSNQSGYLSERALFHVNKLFTLDNYATGYTVAESIHALLDYKPRVCIQGFGKVGASLAYILQKNNIATVVGICDETGWTVNDDSIDVIAIVEKKNKCIEATGTVPGLNVIFSESERAKYQWRSRLAGESDEDFLCGFLEKNTSDIFCPCASRYQITEKVSDVLVRKTFANQAKNKNYIISGANNVFASESLRERLFSLSVESIPEWLSSCGNALLYGELLKVNHLNKKIADDIIENIGKRLRSFLQEARIHADLNDKALYASCFNILKNR